MNTESIPKLEKHGTFHYGTPSDNLLILGDNLKVLKHIEDEFLGRIQCIYMDPPYNSCNPFNMFVDCAPQEEWERIMSERLEILWPFLSETGSIWISIDDSEFADLKVLCDRLWGREHFVLCIVRQKNKYPSSVERPVVHMHDYILVYAKNPKCVKLHTVEMGTSRSYSDGTYTLENLLIWTSALNRDQSINEHIFKVTTPDGNTIMPPKDRCWSVTYEQYQKMRIDGTIWFDDKSIYPYIRHLAHKNGNIRPTSLWLEDEVSSNQEARYEIKKYDAGRFFYVPKPEKLLYKILSICTDPGDWVLDPYLGSGTTVAVSHKMLRNWIGIEQGKDQFFNICIPRLNDVIEGTESTVVTKMINWNGGGGFSCVELKDS